MKTILFVVLLVSLTFAQGYDAEIAWYDMNFYKVISGTPVVGAQMTEIDKDTSLTFMWENGTENTPGYISQLVREEPIIIKVNNDPSIWVSGSAVVTRDIILSDGLYEVTVDCSDLAGNMSGHSEPIYLNVNKPKAKVVINFRSQ